MVGIIASLFPFTTSLTMDPEIAPDIIVLPRSHMDPVAALTTIRARPRPRGGRDPNPTMLLFAPRLRQL